MYMQMKTANFIIYNIEYFKTGSEWIRATEIIELNQ